MSRAPSDRPDFPQRLLVYWCRNPVFAIPRPGALTYDGKSLTCIDNELATIFGASLSGVTVKKRCGIFRVYIGGKRISYLVPIRGLLSPVPSKPLLTYLNITVPRSWSGKTAEARGLLDVSRNGGRAAADRSVIDDGGNPTSALVGYFVGMRTLGKLFRDIGVWKRWG